MTTARATSAILAAAFALLPLATPTAAQMASLPRLPPRTDVSPAGRWTLRVEPSDGFGRGPATHRCLDDGVLAWDGERPWSKRRGAVSDGRPTRSPRRRCS